MSGPEVPFPLDADFGVEGSVGGKPLRKRLGTAQSYTADEIAGTVTIAAIGEAPNLNTIVQLVQLPNMIFPPQFALFFTDQETVLPATRPFRVTTSFHTERRLEAIQVQDANGIHKVPVRNF